jgi:CBS domain-containing protein
MGDLTVGDAMVADPPRAAAWSTVAELVDGPFRHTQHSAVAVTDFQGRAVGVVTMQDIKSVPAERWASTTAVELANRAQPSVVAPDEPLVEAVVRIDRTNGGYAVVVADGALVGLIGPDEVRRAIELGRPRVGRSGPPRGLVPPPPPRSVPSQRWEPPVTAG